MSQNPILNAANPIVAENGTMSDAFRDFTLLLTRALPIIGIGPPEGAVEAAQFSLYINSAGATGSIEYRKMQTDISGDRSMGWVAV